MGYGLDYVTGPPIDVLKSAKIQNEKVAFVCRYLSFVNELTKVKLLSANEAKALNQAGIAVVSNYEWYANRALEGFASGVQDAQIAASQHADCGGPADKPIYFSVDCDCDGSQTVEYFKGVASVIGLSRTGVYGSYRVVKYLLDNGLVKWAWQTYAWSGGQWDPRAHIRQYQNGVNLAGHEVDYNESMHSDFGQWGTGETEMLQLSDPMGKYFTSNAAGDRWHCAKTGQDIAYALLNFYRQHNGIFGLPITGEIYLAQYPGTAIEACERGIPVYDPERKFDNPPGAGDCYLLHIDSGVGQQLIAKPLLTSLQGQVDTLTKQVADLTSELATLKAQPTTDTSALEQQIADLTTQLASYKQAVAQVEAAIAPVK